MTLFNQDEVRLSSKQGRPVYDGIRLVALENQATIGFKIGLRTSMVDSDIG